MEKRTERRGGQVAKEKKEKKDKGKKVPESSGGKNPKHARYYALVGRRVERKLRRILRRNGKSVGIAWAQKVGPNANELAKKLIAAGVGSRRKAGPRTTTPLAPKPKATATKKPAPAPKAKELSLVIVQGMPSLRWQLGEQVLQVLGVTNAEVEKAIRENPLPKKIRVVAKKRPVKKAVPPPKRIAKKRPASAGALLSGFYKKGGRTAASAR